jgi:hypothetical protein
MSGQWRAGAAVDADNAATRQDEFVDAKRHAGVREALNFIGAAQGVDLSPSYRQAHAARLLAHSVESQARVSGLGRVTIPVVGVA